MFILQVSLNIPNKKSLIFLNWYVKFPGEWEVVPYGGREDLSLRVVHPPGLSTPVSRRMERPSLNMTWLPSPYCRVISGSSLICMWMCLVNLQSAIQM